MEQDYRNEERLPEQTFHRSDGFVTLVEGIADCRRLTTRKTIVFYSSDSREAKTSSSEL